MKIPYSMICYEEADINIDGIIKDMKFRGISEDSIVDDIFMNSDYYLSNYSNMDPDGEVQDGDLEALAEEVSNHFREVQYEE